MKEKIICPECAKRGKRSWLASAEGVRGDGFLYMYCKKCKKEIRMPVAELKRE